MRVDFLGACIMLFVTLGCSILRETTSGGIVGLLVVNALAAQYPFDKAAVEAHLPWANWANDDGDLDAAKLADGDTGLKATVLGGGAAEPGAWNSSKWGSLFRRLTKAGHQAPLVVAD